MSENLNNKAIYVKYSSHGQGNIPLGAEGNILLYVDHPVTTKLLIDFGRYGKAIVPLSSVKLYGFECKSVLN